MNANALQTETAYSISNAGVFDIYGIWKLERLCFPKDAYDLLTLLNLVITPNTLRLKAVSSEGLVGFLAAEYKVYDHTNWIVTIGVSPRYEGHGIGHALMDRAEQSCTGIVERIKLTVRRSNVRAIGLYQSCGYQWAGTYRGYYHDGEDGLVMEKNLTHH